MKLIPLIGLVVLGLTSCTHYVPETLDPRAELDALAKRGPIGSPPEPLNALSAELFPLASAVEVGDGLRVAEVNALALFHAPSLVAARDELKLKGAELLRAGLLPNPELFLGPRLALDGGGLIFPASIAVEIPLDGRLSAERRRAAAELEAARLELLSREAGVLVSVRRQLIRIAGLAMRRDILAGFAQANEEVVSRALELVSAGESDHIALGLATLARDEANHDVMETEVALASSRIELLTYIGLLPNPAIEIVTDRTLLAPPAAPSSETHGAIVEHPSLQALEASYRAREHDLEREIARQFPELRLGPELESDDGELSIGLGVALSLPLFDSNEGGIAVARQLRSMKREAWRATLVDLASREALARAKVNAAERLINVLREQTLPAAEAAEQALLTRSRAGQSTSLEDLATHAAIARARVREVELTEEIASLSLERLWHSGALFAPLETVPGAREEEAR